MIQLWLRIGDQRRRAYFYLKLGLYRFGRAQLPYKSCAEKLCNKSQYIVDLTNLRQLYPDVLGRPMRRYSAPTARYRSRHCRGSTRNSYQSRSDDDHGLGTTYHNI